MAHIIYTTVNLAIISIKIINKRRIIIIIFKYFNLKSRGYLLDYLQTEKKKKKWWQKERIAET